MNIVYVKKKRKPNRRYFYAAGLNDYSVFGNGFFYVQNTLQLIDVENSTDNVWKMLSSTKRSATNMFGIKNDGTLWFWGTNTSQVSGLGIADNLRVTKPTQVGTDTNWDYISNGVNHALAIKTNGTLWACGYNGNGGLGIGNTTNQSTFVQVGTDTNWEKVYAGQYSSFGIKTNGTLWSWGNNFYGQLGLNDTDNRTTPVQVGSDTNWEKITFGSNFAFGLKTNKTIVFTGDNSYGQAGDNYSLYKLSPTELDFEYGTDSDEWKMVLYNQTQNGFCIGLKNNGTLWSWGSNINGTLGRNNKKYSGTPGQIGTDDDWDYIAVGETHVLAVKTDGTLWGWGSNSWGQLQTSATSEYIVPTQIGTDTNWSKVAAAVYASFGLKTDGTIWSGGVNLSGITGQGVNAYSFTAPMTKIGTATDWVDIVAGNIHCFAIKSNGTLWTWGTDANGRTGRGTASGTTNSPTQVGTDTNWSKVSAGANHSHAIKTNGTLWATGFNGSGQLGRGNTTQLTTFTQVGSDTNWDSVCSGNYNTTAVKTTGTLWGCGNNAYGSVGDGTTTNRTSFVQVGSATDWNYASTGVTSSLGLRNGVLWVWGNNNHTQLGLGDSERYYYEFTNSTSGSYWEDVSADENSVLAIKEETTNQRELWGWGQNNNGDLGLGNSNVYYVPTQVGSDTNWSKIAKAASHSLAIKTNGTLWATGFNGNGQLGLGNTTNQNTFVQVGNNTNWVDIYTTGSNSYAKDNNDNMYSCGANFYDTLGYYNFGSLSYSFINSIPDINDWKEIYCGGDYASSVFGIRKDGTLWAWGNNEFGQLGLGNNNYSLLIPTQVGTDDDWDKVFTGYYGTQTFALKTDGTLWATGSNGNGQLGIGNTTSQNTFVQVGTDTWSFVCLGGGHSMGIKSNGTLWAWGSHSNGRTGLNLTSGQATSPTQVGSDTNWSVVTAGPFHTHAVKTTGTLWGWGSNWGRQLGDGTTTQRNVPVQIGSATDWVYIDDSNDGGMGLKSDGSIWGWGQNGLGSIGSGNTTTPTVPIQCGNSTYDWEKIAVGYRFGIALKTNGTLWGWGYNSNGLLGYETFEIRTSPFQLSTYTDWVSIATASYASLGLRKNNT